MLNSITFAKYFFLRLLKWPKIKTYYPIHHLFTRSRIEINLVFIIEECHKESLIHIESKGDVDYYSLSKRGLEIVSQLDNDLLINYASNNSLNTDLISRFLQEEISDS